MSDVDPDDEQGIVTCSITIVRTFWPSREQEETRDTIRVDTEGNPTLVESLGMLEFAKLSVIDPGDDEDDEL